MAEKPLFQQPSLPPTLLVDCKFTWKKLLIFLAFGMFAACFLYVFGFGATFIETLLFCGCASLPGLVLIIAANLLPKPTSTIVALLKLSTLLCLGSLIGALIFVMLHGGAPLSIFGQQSNIVLKMLFLNAFCGTSIVFFFKSGERIAEAKRLIAEERLINLNMKTMAVEMELKLLQAQIEPHFLFNTLSNVISLIDSQPDKATAMLNHFCNFLRASLHIARDSSVPLAQEIDLIRNYLDIQKIRMGERLDYRIGLPSELLEKRLPPLLIQPLVENSIKHGLEPKLEGGRLTITGELTAGLAKIAVSDSGTGITENALGNGVGLENLRQRIQMFSHSRGRLILEENMPCGVQAMIEVPV